MPLTPDRTADLVKTRPASPAPFDAAAALEALYATENHFAIVVLWDGGWDVFDGVPMGNWFGRMCSGKLHHGEAAGNFRDLESAVKWLCRRVCERYPKSAFAREWEPRL
jgi:hypothetical protein